MFRQTLAALIIAILFQLNGWAQQETVSKLHFLSGTVNLSIDAGPTIGFTDYADIHPAFMVRVSGQFNLESYTNGVLGIRGFIQDGTVAATDDSRLVDEVQTAFFSIGVGPIYTFQFDEDYFPYAFIGISNTTIDPKDKFGNDLYYNRIGDYNKNQLNYHFEVGSRYRLNNEFFVNAQIGLQYSYSDNWEEVVVSGDDIMLQFISGFTYNLFTKQDSDNDGVQDDEDKCPNTPKGIVVDRFGCPSDYDKDGVADFEDKCPQTPSGVTVDENGCPRDTDSDGVPDYLDHCPYTKAGMTVNSTGCPDSDGDGVGDDKDKCPNTPPDIQVDMFGCPRDTDKDGVPDFLDRCPNTPLGTPVDKKGCERIEEGLLELPEKKFILSTDESFLPGLKDFTISGVSRLEKITIIFEEYPDTRWAIEAYTDNVGANDFNLDLSQKQADLVKEFFVKMGIAEDRLTAKGIGKADPVASNENIDGRAKNRRIEIKLIEE